MRRTALVAAAAVLLVACSDDGSTATAGTTHQHVHTDVTSRAAVDALGRACDSADALVAVGSAQAGLLPTSVTLWWPWRSRAWSWATRRPTAELGPRP